MEHYGTLPERWNPYQYCKKCLAFLVPEKCATPHLIKKIIDMKNIIESYGLYLYSMGYKDRIRRSMLATVKEFSSYYTIREMSEVSQQDIKDYYEYLQVRPSKRRSGCISEATVRLYVDMLANFFKWLEVSGQIGYNPVSGCVFKRQKGLSREPLSLEEIRAVFAAAVDAGERALLHLCYSCGLRRSEAVALNMRDVHFRDRLLYVREGKGNKRRVIPMPDRVSRDLEQYYVQRLEINHRRQRDEPSFMVNNWGVRMRGKEYNIRLKAMVDRAGINKPEVSLHHLRHSIATHLLQGGMQMVYVRDFLGHSELSTTHVYARAGKEQIAGI